MLLTESAVRTDSPGTLAVMEPGLLLPCVDQFMLSPLVTWVSGAKELFISLQRSSVSKRLRRQSQHVCLTGEDIHASRRGRPLGLLRPAGRNLAEGHNDANVSLLQFSRVDSHGHKKSAGLGCGEHYCTVKMPLKRL